VRLLFLSDTHLGLDLPQRPRVVRRRRGPEFFAAFEDALAPAARGEVDLVVHGGDVFFRSRVPAGLVERAFAPLRSLAERGIAVCIVPGNHERSALPHPLLAAHPGIHVFDRPRTFRLALSGFTLALAGFPFVRRGLRGAFPDLVDRTGWRDVPADARLLCLHQCVEGATVGPQTYVFRDGDDVIRGRDLPWGFAAVLAGHVHRHQILTRDLRGRALPVPVLYAGSTERTSFAERDEAKGFLQLDVAPDGSGGGRLSAVRFREIATRPMALVSLPAERLAGPALRPTLSTVLARQSPNAIVRIRIDGRGTGGLPVQLRADTLRTLAPSTMNVSVRWSEDPTFRIET
jgi:DNA repair exonuclease SbcCD nuclease subunit